MIWRKRVAAVIGAFLLGTACQSKQDCTDPDYCQPKDCGEYQADCEGQ